MREERGFALVITLIVTALLVALLVEFVSEVYVDTSHSHNFVASQQAGILAASGIDGGIAMLKKSADIRKLKGQSATTLLELWAQPFTYDAGVGTVTISIEEESGKLDLNSATSPNGDRVDIYSETARRLLTNLELSPDLYDTLSDWVDMGDTPRTNGAETNYYSTLKPPYQAPNEGLNTFEELALVKGFTPQVLTKLRSCVTVYGSDRGKGGQAKININTAPKELLAALDPTLMRGDLVSRILEDRKAKPMLNLANYGSLAQTLAMIVGFQGTIYRIRAEGKVGESVSVAEAVIDVNTTPPTYLYWREY